MKRSLLIVLLLAAPLWAGDNRRAMTFEDVFSAQRIQNPVLSPDGRTAYYAGYDAKLHAVNTADGTARWVFSLGKEVRASAPAVDANGVIYIGCYDQFVYAINPDGTLKSFVVINAADQGEEIAFIKTVVERAAPFSPFPPDINRAARSMAVRICIMPASGGGFGFSRAGDGQGC